MKITVKDHRWFIFKNYCESIGLTEKDSNYSLKKAKKLFSYVYY